MYDAFTLKIEDPDVFVGILITPTYSQGALRIETREASPNRCIIGTDLDHSHRDFRPRIIHVNSATPNSMRKGILKGCIVRCFDCATSTQSFWDYILALSWELDHLGYDRHLFRRVVFDFARRYACLSPILATLTLRCQPSQWGSLSLPSTPLSFPVEHIAALLL